MSVPDITLLELADDYCQKRYDKTLELLINQLMNQERDILKSVHHGFGLVDIGDFKLGNNFMSHLLSDYFNLKAVDRGKTFIIGDKIRGDFGFVAAKDKDCFLLFDGIYVVPFTPCRNTTWLYPFKIELKDEVANEGELDEYVPILVEKTPGTIYEYDEESFFSFLDEEHVTECKCIDYKTFLCDKYGEEEYNKTIELFKAWSTKIKSLAKLPLSKLRKKNKNLFYETLYKNLFVDGYKLSLTESERKIVTSYLKDCQNSNEISRMIYTFSYTLKGFEQDKEYSDYLDLTFILVSIFKIVEVVFSNLLNEEFGDKVIRDSKGNSIDFSYEKLTLGNMKQFFYSNDLDIKRFLSKHPQLKDNTLTILNTWIDESRNGFLHKHIVEVSNIEQLNKSIVDSLQLLCNLIILFRQK